MRIEEIEVFCVEPAIRPHLPDYLPPMAQLHQRVVFKVSLDNGVAGYGEYRWGPMTWIYGYERSEDLRGPSPDDVRLTVTASDPIRMSTFRISREGDMLVLDGDRLRWEYDVPGGTFMLKTSGGLPIRKYRKVARPEP